MGLKMKEVCHRTGLTDRAVRYYIDSGLLSPSTTENYNGRKNYEFSQADIAMLQVVKTLRAAGFSVEQIKSLQCAEDVRDIVRARMADMDSEDAQNEQWRCLLQKADIRRAVSFEELTVILSSCTVEKQLSEEDVPPDDTFAQHVRAYSWKFGIVLLVTVVWCCIFADWRLAVAMAVLAAVMLVLLMKAAHKWRVLVTVAVLVALVAPRVIGCAVHEPKDTDALTHELMSAVAWEDAAFLKQNDFFATNDTSYRYLKEDYTPAWAYDNQNDVAESCLVVDVHVAQTMDDGMLARYDKHGDIYVREKVTVGYDSPFAWWIGLPHHIERRYEYVIGDRYITVYEANRESWDTIYFEEFLANLLKAET